MVKVLHFIGGMSVVAWFIIGCVLGQVPEFSVGEAIPYWIGGLVSGVFIFAFARVIELLELIYNHMRNVDTHTDKILFKVKQL